MEAEALHHRPPDPRGNETVGEIAYGRIRADILFGRLAPGERLRLEAISGRYGTSISTMREMLSRLGSEGLIVAEGQRGFEVAPVSPQEFREIADLRLVLEAHALARSFAQGDLDWEASVVAAHHKLAVMEERMTHQRAGERVAPEQWKGCDRAFHQALIAACGSRSLLETHATVFDKYLRYQIIAVIFRGEVAAREHGTLLECAIKRDADRAVATLRVHIESCVEFALGNGTPAWATAKPRSAKARAALTTSGRPASRARRPV